MYRETEKVRKHKVGSKNEGERGVFCLVEYFKEKNKAKHTNTDVLPREEPAWLHVYTLAHTVHVNDLLGLCKRTCQQNH